MAVNQILIAFVLALFMLTVAATMILVWRLVRRYAKTPLAAGALMGGLAAIGSITSLLLRGVNENSVVTGLLWVVLCALYGVVSHILDKAVREGMKKPSTCEVVVEVAQPFVLISQFDKLSAALEGRLKGIVLPAPYIEGERSELIESCRHPVVLSDARDYQAFAQAAAELPGVIGVTKGMGWDISEEERAQQLKDLEEAKMRHREERRWQFSRYRRLVEDTTRGDMITYGLVDEVFRKLDYAALQYWLQSVGHCEVEGRLVVLDPMMGFLSFDHFTQQAESGMKAILLVTDALQDRLRGPLLPTERDLAAIQFIQERREKGGKHFLRLHTSMGGPHTFEARYEFFVREQ